jgi:hypothetical protein
MQKGQWYATNWGIDNIVAVRKRDTREKIKGG